MKKHKPFSKRMLESKRRTGSGTHSYKWRIRPTPWKAFLDALAKPRDAALNPFGNRTFVLGFVCLIVVMVGLSTWSDRGNILFHSYSGCPLGYTLSGSACVLPEGTITTVILANGTRVFVDPTTPIQKFTAPNNNLGEFNTAGNVAYQASCTLIDVNAPCMILSSTKPPPPLAVQFQLTTTVKTKGATLNPTSFSTVYKRVTAISTNNTFQFDVTGGHAQTATYTLTTSQTTTLTFYGLQPTVTCGSCTTQAYTGYSEVLTLGPGLSNVAITVVWTTGSNLNFLGAMAVSVNPIGDLSPVVSKELEQALEWVAVNNATVTLGGSDKSYSWGFFLTTNSSVWRTNNPTWTPYNDPSIALFVEIHLDSGPNVYRQTLYVQQKIGETLAQEDTLGCSGSAWLCVSTTLQNKLPGGGYSWYQLNYTGSSPSSLSQPVGSGASCPTTGANGGPACSYEFIGPSSNQNCNGFCKPIGTAKSPVLPLSSSYYAGFFLGSSQLGSGMKFCYDVGSICGGQSIPITTGCVSASMEIDYCIPDPTKTYSPAPTTDSGGFFGSVIRTFGSVGNYVVGGATSLFNAVVAPVANALGGLEGPLVAALNTAFQILTFAAVTVLNTIGNFFGLGNIGSTIQNFFLAVGNFLVNGVGAILGQILNAGNFIVNGVTVLVATGGFYWTRITMFLTAIGNLISVIGLVLNDILALGGFSGNIALFFDWCWGMFKVYDEGTEGFHRWLDFNENVILKIGKVTYFAADHLFTAILKVKQLLTAWL